MEGLRDVGGSPAGRIEVLASAPDVVGSRSFGAHLHVDCVAGG